MKQWRASFQNLGMAINRVIPEKKETNFYWIVCAVSNFFGVCIICQYA